MPSLTKRDPRPDIVVLFTPGNPGLVEYYDVFLSALHDFLARPKGGRTGKERRVRVYALGHVGQSPALASTSESEGGGKGKGKARSAYGEPVLLCDQVAHHGAFLDELRETWGDDFGAGPGTSEHPIELVHIGHSIGSWMILQMLKTRPSLSPQCVALLFPTLSHMSLSPSGRRLGPIITRPALRALVTGLVRHVVARLPRKALSWLVSLATARSGSSSPSSRASTDGLNATVSLVSCAPVVHQALALASDELASVTSLDTAALKRVRHAVRVYYTTHQGDHWVPEHAVDEIVGVLGADARVQRCTEGIKHAFVLDDAAAESLAGKIATWCDHDASQSQ